MVDFSLCPRCNEDMQKFRSDVRRLSLLLCLCAFLSSCRGPYVSRYDNPVPNRRHGVVVRQNKPESTVFLLAVEQLFFIDSGQLRKGILPVMQPIADFARHYPGLDMRIVVYGDDSAVSHRYEPLDNFRADVIAAYFWTQGVLPHRIQTRAGRPGYDVVADNTSPQGSWLNRRVEITFYAPN